MEQRTDVLLSICIPTHNRGLFLKDTLESILPQYNDSIEIVILDSASTDNTKDVVFAYQAKMPGITYCYQDKKMGIDADMSKTVELAKGEYCWLMSDDDAITSEAIGILFAEIRQKYEIYLCNRVVCDLSLNLVKDRQWLSRRRKKDVFRLLQREDLLDYLDSTVEFGAIFSYMSVLIFKRSEWGRVGYDEMFAGTGYAHVMRIFGIINNNGRLKYIERPLVLNRSYNDSFLKQGVVKRFMIDIDGYSLLAKRLFPTDEIVRKLFLKVMTLERPWYQVVKLKAFVKNEENWDGIRKKLLYCGYSPALLGLCEMLAIMKPLIRMAVNLRYAYNTCPWHKNIYALKTRRKDPSRK